MPMPGWLNYQDASKGERKDGRGGAGANMTLSFKAWHPSTLSSVNFSNLSSIGRDRNWHFHPQLQAGRGCYGLKSVMLRCMLICVHNPEMQTFVSSAPHPWGLPGRSGANNIRAAFRMNHPHPAWSQWETNLTVMFLFPHSQCSVIIFPAACNQSVCNSNVNYSLHNAFLMCWFNRAWADKVTFILFIFFLICIAYETHEPENKSHK